MSLFRELYVKLPAKVQDYTLERLIKTGRVFQAPVFKMLLHSFRFFGGDLGELRQAFTAQANRAYIYTGTKNLKELQAWTDRIDFKGIISEVKCPVLIVHGEKDELLDPSHAREITNLVKGKKELRIVPNGDHMCTHALESDVGPYMFDWLSRELTQGHKATQ